MFAVNAGLSPGNKVVVDGADRLRDGAKVLLSAAEGSSIGGATARPPDAVAPGEKRADVLNCCCWRKRALTIGGSCYGLVNALATAREW